MTIEEILLQCERYRGVHSSNMYEHFKKKIIALNPTADEYENAVIKIAGIIGI
jgi:hypothetical protein